MASAHRPISHTHGGRCMVGFWAVLSGSCGNPQSAYSGGTLAALVRTMILYTARRCSKPCTLRLILGIRSWTGASRSVSRVDLDGICSEDPGRADTWLDMLFYQDDEHSVANTIYGYVNCLTDTNGPDIKAKNEQRAVVVVVPSFVLSPRQRL